MVTIWGSIVNVFLLIFKFTAGIMGHSAAMIADAVHSLSDFVTDVIVLVFVHISNLPQDENHDYGHGKFETLASTIIGFALLAVGCMILYSGCKNTWMAVQGAELKQPGMIALVAALVSIGLKEYAYRFTVSTGRKVKSEAVVANAWHHRSDALSSIGTAVGIGGAILLGKRWAVLDPIAAIVVSIFIIKAAYKLLKKALGDLLEQSLPESVEHEIVEITEGCSKVQEVHHLRTRHIGSQISIEMHVRMPGNLSLYEAHEHVTEIEQRLREHFGNETFISVHAEPTKVNGTYQKPE